jgi:hypothetical protein
VAALKQDVVALFSCSAWSQYVRVDTASVRSFVEPFAPHDGRLRIEQDFAAARPKGRLRSPPLHGAVEARPPEVSCPEAA